MIERTNAQIFYEVCKELRFDVQGYSGRRAHGLCLAFLSKIPLADVAHLARALAKEEELREDHAYDIFENVEQDSVGKEWIVYFPRLRWNDITI